MPVPRHWLRRPLPWETSSDVRKAPRVRRKQSLIEKRVEVREASVQTDPMPTEVDDMSLEMGRVARMLATENSSGDGGGVIEGLSREMSPVVVKPEEDDGDCIIVDVKPF